MEATAGEPEEIAKPEVFEAKVPSGFTRGAPKITLRDVGAMARADRNRKFALYGDDENPAVVSWRVGKGTILWWAGATPLTNSGLLLENNLEFFLDAVSYPASPADAQPEIYWDEYFHGERSSLSAYIGKTPLPWGMLQIAIIGIAVLLAFARRSGPIAVPAVVSRLSPLEFVDTLCGPLSARAC